MKSSRRPAPVHQPARLRPVLLAACLAAASAGSAWAQSSAAAANAANAANTLPGSAARPLALDLPAQPLDQALQALSRQSGAQIIFPTELAAGRRAPALQGTLTVRQALDRLVAGSGLVVKAQDEHTFTLERASEARVDAGTLPLVRARAVDEVAATAYAGGQVARVGQLGLLGQVSVMETPFNVTRYTAELVENQQALSLKDVLDNDPSVRVSSPRGAENDQVMIRGFEFNAREALFNGMLGMADTRGSMVEAAERIEIHKGPSAMLSGVSPWGSSPGGSINYVLKRAGKDPLTRVTASLAGDSQLGMHLDVGRRFGERQQFGVRLNTVYRDGDAEVDHTHNRNKLAAVALDYRGEQLRLSADLSYQDRTLRGGWSSTRIGSAIAIPGAPDTQLNSKQPWEFYDGQNHYAILRAEYDITPDWTVAAAYGDNASDEVYLLTIDSINNLNGNKSGTPYWIPARSENTSRELSLKGRFSTGGVQHQFSVTANQNEARRGQLNWSVPGYGNNSLPSNIYQPVYYPAPDISSLHRDGLTMAAPQDFAGVAVADLMKFWDERLVLMVGARDQKVKNSVYNRRKTSPSAGVVFKAVEGVSVYASYIERLSAGGTVGTGYTNSGEVFQPFVTDQYETGVKWDLGRFTATASLFQVAVPSTVSVPNATGLPTLKQDGEERHRGLELNVYGEPLRGVRLLGGVMLMDAEMTKTQGGVDDGKRARGAPVTNLNLGGEWDLGAVQGLTLSGRVVYTSRENIDLSGRPDRRIPSWTRVDAGARYTTSVAGHPTVLRLNIDNLFDRNYWAAASRGVLTLASPRSVRLSASVDF